MTAPLPPLAPFVREWKLPLNPEDLEAMAYAVLRPHDADAPAEQVKAEVRAQITQSQRKKDELARHYSERRPE